jgi:hypothetical protein
VRQLYTDQDEVLFEATRPVILNGIEDIVARPDLADRAIFLTLEPIPEERRRPGAELWAAFEVERPRILGALLDAVVGGLKRLPETRLEGYPRMADFAHWVTAAEPALWRPGTFMTAYEGNRAEAVESVIDSDPIASSLRKFMVGREQWAGTATELLGELTGVAGERTTRSKEWPGSNKLKGRLTRAAPLLRKVGIGIEFDRVPGGKRTRTITVTVSDWVGKEPSQPSQPPRPQREPNEMNGLDRDGRDSTRDGRDNTRDGTVPCNPLKSNNQNGRDDRDDKNPIQSRTPSENGGSIFRGRI